MLSWFKGYVLWIVAVLVGLLLLANIYLMYRNNLVITFTKQQQEEGVMNLTSLHLCVESILYNLISNANKYRHPERLARIVIQSKPVNGMFRLMSGAME